MSIRQGGNPRYSRTSRTRSRKPLPRALVIILSALMTAAVALGCYAAVLIYKAKNNPASLFVPRETGQLGTQAPDTTAAPVPATQDLTDVEPGVAVTPVPDDERDVRLRWSSEGYRFNDDIITVAFMGIDVLEERGPLGFRADTIILGIIDTETGDATLLSVPRDTYTMVQRVDRDGTIVSYEMNRINASFAYGQGRTRYSYRNTMDALSYLMGGIPIEYYIGFDMDGMIDIIDCVGGITMSVSPDVAQAAQIPSGTYRLDGRQALEYVRARKNVGGDPARIGRQQEFVLKFLADIKRRNPIEYVPRLYDAAKYYFDTNLSTEQMAVLALLLKDLNLEEINTVTLPGENRTIDKISAWYCDEQALMDIVRGLYFIKD
ncbi:MAG: LCP family protein [Christensenellales bacterium]|jgi:LCP family protein required for cell wall assembly